MGNNSTQYTEFAFYYDRLMDDIDYDSWSNYIIEIINKQGIEHKDVLEMACGTGTIAVNMAKRGFDVTAFDLSDDMLSIAYDKAISEGVKINFIAQDMRNITIPKSYGVILCLCDSINYITEAKDLFNIFKWVYSHLKEGGLFIFDINSSFKLKNIIGNNTFTFNEEDIAYIWDNSILEDGTVEFYLTFFIKEGDLYRRFDEVHKEKIYETDDILKLLKESGFNHITVNEAFTFDVPTESSERINFIVK